MDSLDYKKILSHKRQIIEYYTGFKPLKLAFLSGSTIGSMKDVLELYLLSHGISCEFLEKNQWYEEAVFNCESLKLFDPDIIYIQTTSRNICFISENGAEPITPDAIFYKIKEACEKLAEETRASVIINNFELLPYRIMGNADSYMGGYNHIIAETNLAISEYAAGNNRVFINDINWLSAYYGLKEWFDNKQWYMYKYPFSLEAIPLVCDNISKIIKSLLGCNKKMLILDGDNTLWGGSIGDIGPENIRLGGETPSGEAFLDFQKYIKGVQELGVLLGFASKNEDAAARSAFEAGNSIIKYNDFIAFKANWEPKYRNIIKITDELNLTVGGIVFADDSPVETEEAKQFIPEITCVRLFNPENYINLLDRYGFFELTIHSRDDKNRQEYYKQNTERKKYEKKFSNYMEYLISLNMICTIKPINHENASRVRQLIEKTNQFNLTGKTITEADIIAAADKISLCGVLSDKFGDNGIVIAIIASLNMDEAEIINWVMSCRVFKRTIEFEFFEAFVDICRQRGISKIIGSYTKTPKNKPVESLYRELGFSQISGGGITRWKLDINGYSKMTGHVMEVTAE